MTEKFFRVINQQSHREKVWRKGGSGAVSVCPQRRWWRFFKATPIDLSEIQLLLKRREQLVQWTPDTEIRSRNEFTDRGNKKDYDAIVTVRSNGSERTFALEHERTPKARREYLRIKRRRRP